MSHSTVNVETATHLLRNAFESVAQSQRDAITAAARLVADAIVADGVIQVFGTGHSRSFAMEIAGRAGGLVPANKLSLTDLVFYGDASPADIMDPKLERDESVAQRLLAVHTIEPTDIFIICSNSGGNGATVELARQVKARGHQLIAVTSMDHTTRVSSRHSSGQRLYELADVVIDNCGPFGDAALQLSEATDGAVTGAITAVSSLTGALVAQLLVTEVCGLLLEVGHEVPILISANIPGGDEHNDRLRARYAGRVRTDGP